MKSQLNWNNSQDSGISPPQNLQTQQRPLNSKLNDLWQNILSYFYASSEPRIWQTEDGLGRTAWSAYDPTTRRSIEQASMTELRIWLEKRYY